MFSRCAITLAMTIAVTSAASASVVINPLSASGEHGTGSFGPDATMATNLINNSGLSDTVGTLGTTAPIPASYPTVTADAIFAWRLRTNTLPTTTDPLTFNFNLDPVTGGSAQGYTLTGLHVWNYSELWSGNYYNDRGVQATELQYSTDGGATYIVVGNITLPRAPDDSSYTGDDVSFGPLTSVTNVRFYGGSNYGSTSYIGMQEVRFIADAVPEPASLALFGLAAPLLLGRRTKRS